MTTQVIERHIVRGLENIFSPLFVSKLTDEEAANIAAEPLDAQNERQKLEEKIAQFKIGQQAFRSVLGVTVQ